MVLRNRAPSFFVDDRRDRVHHQSDRVSRGLHRPVVPGPDLDAADGPALSPVGGEPLRPRLELTPFARDERIVAGLELTSAVPRRVEVDPRQHPVVDLHRNVEGRRTGADELQLVGQPLGRQFGLGGRQRVQGRRGDRLP